MSCICDTDILYPQNDQILTLKSLTTTDPDTDVDTPVSDASVHATLKDSQGNAVDGLNDLLLSPVGSPFTGDYSGEIDGDLFNPEPGKDYTLIIDGSDAFGKIHLEKTITVAVRTQ
jgi:hypothetical protein